MEPALQDAEQPARYRALAPGYRVSAARRGDPPADRLDSARRGKSAERNAGGRAGRTPVGQGGAHRLENTRGHKDSWYLYIPDEELPSGEIVTCEMPPGSLLLFSQLLPHRSTENTSDSVRWSIDLRWQRPEALSGFEGIKDPILMRTARDPDYQIDWPLGPQTGSRTPCWKRRATSSPRASPGRGWSDGQTDGVMG